MAFRSGNGLHSYRPDSCYLLAYIRNQLLTPTNFSNTSRRRDRREKGFAMNSTQKVAIVTGASQGIGAGLVNAFRERNYRVIATSRSIKPSDDPDILTIAGDIGSSDTAKRVISQGLERFGRIDTLVNNAGIFIAKPFTKYTEADFLLMISTNVAGFFHITQAAVEVMERNLSGHVVSITTSLVDNPNVKVPSVLVSLTKGGLNAATRSLAIEYAARGIRFNAVSPGIIKTSMHPPETHAALSALHPVGRMGEIRDITEAVLYLESASFVTGEILHIDGGQSAGH
jgi:NAD(P)-dependent dehydrogenase (short-subunit alcohol dehydrogenase family)